MPCACIYNDRKIWGRQLWTLLHNVPIRLNNLQKVPHAVEFIKNFCSALPCEECHNHCKEYMEKNIIVLSNPNNLDSCKKDIAKFLYDFHNHVNSLTQKNLYTNFDNYQKTKPPQPDLNEIKKIFDNSINKNFFINFLTPVQKQYNHNFINAYINIGH